LSGYQPFSVKDVVQIAKNYDAGRLRNEALYDSIVGIAGERNGINNNRLGWWIKRHVGQIVNGLRIIQDKSVVSNVAKWKIESVS
jgi:hypothetical protein